MLLPSNVITHQISPLEFHLAQKSVEHIIHRDTPGLSIFGPERVSLLDHNLTATIPETQPVAARLDHLIANDNPLFANRSKPTVCTNIDHNA